MLLTHLFENKHMTEADIASVNWNTDSEQDKLNEFAPGAGGDDEAGDDPYKYPKPESYRRSVDYFGQFEADHFDREDFDDATGVFKGYWGDKQIAYFKFDNPARTSSDDSGRGWYYEPQSDGNSDNTITDPAVDNTDERKQQELSMIRAFLKSGNRPNPDSQIGRLMKKHGVTEGQDNPYGYRKGQTVKLDNGTQGRVIDIFDDSIEVLLVGGRTVTVDFRDAQVISEQGVAEGEVEMPTGQATGTGAQTDTPPSRSFAVKIVHDIIRQGKALIIWTALEDILPRDYPRIPFQQQTGKFTEPQGRVLLDLHNDGFSIVKQNISSQDIAETIASKFKGKGIAAEVIDGGIYEEQGVAEDSENAFAPVKLHDQQSNAYGDAILDIADQFEDKFSDEKANEYATAIATVGHAFLNNGMRSGRAKLFGLEQAVYKHVLMVLDQQGFDIVKDIIRPHFKPDNKVPFKNTDNVSQSKTVDTVSESAQTKQKRHHFIYEADYFGADFQARLDANRAELDKTRAAGDAKWQAYKDQQAQEKADYIQQNAASNAEHVKQREEEYQARLKRDREAQERQDARTKPGASQADNDHVQPHGDTANEIKMFMAGTKPASAIGVMDQPMWQNLIDSGKYVIKQLFGEKGKPGSIVIGQPGEEDRVEKIASLIQGASDRANTGDFSAYHNSNYHRWLGRLLGYPADKIEKFITDYFKDVKDLAKGRFDEGDISQLEKAVADAPVEPIANMEAKEKVGNMDADAFDAAMSRLKQLAGSGPLKTVWDPKKRVYRNMPTAVQPKK
jgi:hypothetical protein